MKTRQATYRPLLLAVGLAALFLLQGCYVEWGDGKRIGQDDTAFPGASVERGCVVKIESGGRLFPPDYRILFRNPSDGTSAFTRKAEGLKLEVGKCYEWKLGFRDPSLDDLAKDGFDGMKEISNDTVHEISPTEGG
jgi:hypothetical protein